MSYFITVTFLHPQIILPFLQNAWIKVQISSRLRVWIEKTEGESSNFSYLFCEWEQFCSRECFCLCDKFKIKNHLSYLISFKWIKKQKYQLWGKKNSKASYASHLSFTKITLAIKKTKEKFNSMSLHLFLSTWSIQTNAITVSAFDLIRVKVGCKNEVNCTNNTHVNHVTKQSNLVDSLRIWTCCLMQNNHQEQYTSRPAGGLPHKPSLLLTAATKRHERAAASEETITVFWLLNVTSKYC